MVLSQPEPFHLRAQEILERMADAFLALDRDWCIVYANREACRINQKPLEEFLGKSFWEEWPAVVGTEVERQYRRAMADQVETHFEHHYADGPYDVWLALDGYPTPDGLNIFYRDITRRKQAEDALLTSEGRFRQMADAMPHIAWTTGSDGAVDYYNQRWYDYSGMTLEQTRNWGWERVIHPDDLERAGSVWRAAIRDGVVSEVEYRLRRADGAYRWHLGRSMPVWEGSQIVRWVGTATDIEDRRAAEEALRRSREDLQLAIDAARIGTFYCDWPLDKIIWNDACLGHFFLPPNSQVDFDLFYSLLHPEDREPTRQAIERAQAERVAYDVEYRTLAPDGRTRWVNAVGRFYYAPDGSPTRFDGITIDISARKHVEEELRARAARETLINSISAAIRAMTDPEAILETAAALLGRALGADRCYFSVYDASADVVRIVRDWHRPGLVSIAGAFPWAEYQEYQEALSAQGTAVIPDSEDRAVAPPVRQVLAQSGIRAFLAVPRFDQGKFVAALAAAMSEGPRAWTPAEVSLTEAVLAQTWTAAEAARVAQRERTIAQQLQAALQPPTPATVPGLELASYYRPALAEDGVGGDFSDVFSADRGVTFLVVGDLSGKGLAAASQVALVRNMLRFALYNGRTVAGPIAALNATLADHGLLGGFTTLFAARYEAETRLLTYVNCGQDAGLILRATSGRVKALPPTGPVLGAFEGAAFVEQSLPLDVGDVLALYTDGLTEAGPSRTALLTGDGVAALLQAQAGQTDAQVILEALIAGVDTYSQGGVRDDQCLLVAVVTSG